MDVIVPVDGGFTLLLPFASIWYFSELVTHLGKGESSSFSLKFTDTYRNVLLVTWISFNLFKLTPGNKPSQIEVAQN